MVNFIQKVGPQIFLLKDVIGSSDGHLESPGLGWTGVGLGLDWGGGAPNFGLMGAQLPPPGPSPSTEEERKRVDVYTRKYTLESTAHKRRLPPSGVGGFRFCPDPNSHFYPPIKLFYIYGKIDLEKLITTNPI